VGEGGGEARGTTNCRVFISTLFLLVPDLRSPESGCEEEEGANLKVPRY